MDGRRRFLRSLRAAEPGVAPAPSRFPSPRSRLRRASLALELVGARPRARPCARSARLDWRGRLIGRLSGPAATYCFVSALFLCTGAYGVWKGGHYDAFVAAHGAPSDVVAKALGFTIKAVTITGQSELTEPEILDLAGVGPRNSLLFLDVAKIRERLKQMSLIKDVSVTKLYPDRLLIEVEERRPFALWQMDGVINIIAADGAPLDAMRDQRFIHLPLVVGVGANEKLNEYMALLDAAGDLRERIRAGVLVSGRRWNLKMTNGLDVRLPETDPAAAVASLVRLQRESRILDKDILSLDLRQPGRVVARMTADAAAARAETIAHRPRAKGGQT